MKSKARKRVIATFLTLIMAISLLPANLPGGGVTEVYAAIELTAPTTNDSEELSFNSDVFGETVAFTGGTFLSEKGYILFDAGSATVTPNGSGHGLMFTSDITFTMKVPANKMGVITLNECAYASAYATVTAGGTEVVTNQSIDCGNSDKVDVELYKYRNETSSEQELIVTLTTSNTGYVHGIKYEVTDIPTTATVSGTVDVAVNGEKLVFKKDGTAVGTATITDGNYSVDLEVGSSYTVEFKKSALYEVLTGATIDLTAVTSGTTVTNDITYSTLPIQRLTVDGAEVTWTFTSGIFGSTGTVEADTMSPDGIVTLNGVNMSYNSGGHGLIVQNGSEIAINVPAGQTTVTLTACKFGKDTATAGLYIDGAKVSDSVILYDATDGKELSLVCTSDADTTVVLKVEGSNVGYFHYIKAKTESVNPSATVSGTIDTSVNGEKLLFKENGATIANATIANGSYSVELPVGSEYTVEFENSGTYKVSTGATVDLTSVSAGTAVTNNITFVAWDTTKTAIVTVGGTTFTIKPGASDTDVFSVTVSSGDGSVELTTATTAIVWANLGGAGNGSVSNVTYGNGATGTVSGNTITVTFAGSTLPESYTLQVKDNSATGVPVKDGSTKTYSLKDGSVISTLWDGKADSTKIKNGKTISSADKLVTFTGNKGIWYNGTQHGVYINDTDVVTVKVAGNATVDFELCQYGQASEMLTATAPTGKVYLSTDETQNSISMKTASDGGLVSFVYEGDATTLTFTLTGGVSGSSYIHSIIVTNEAEKTTTNESAVKVKPSILTNAGVAGNLTVTPNGQTLNFKHTGGALPVKDTVAPLFTTDFTDSGASFYAFPATADWNKLELEIKVNSIEANSNNNGVFVGAINTAPGVNVDGVPVTAAVATAGVRNLTNLRGIYTKKAEYAGAGQANSTIVAGETVKITAYKNADKYVIESLWSTGNHTGSYKYNDADFKAFEVNGANSSVNYGLVLAGVNADVTNMVYYDKDGNVLYDQNEYYNPIGEAPVAEAVTATAAADRTNIVVNWTGSQVYGDGKYVLQVSKDGGAWTDVSDIITEYTYEYPVASTDSGSYKFRVCGTLGNSDSQSVNNRNTYVTSNEVTIEAALAAPVITLNIVSPADKVNLSWTESAGATSYEVYRRSADEVTASLLTTVTATSYVDTAVTAEVPYYYYVIAKSADNFSNPQDEVWTLPTAGHTGKYQYDDATIAITKKSYDTVFTNKVTVGGLVTAPGEVSIEVNGTVAATANVAEANGTFEFKDVTIDEGRNDVVVYLKYNDGAKITRKALNFVYLTNYDYVVDAAYEGTAGDTTEYGVPQYKTITEAVNAIGTGNSSRKVIFVREGSYEERLDVYTPYVSIVGEDSKKTIIHNYPADFVGATGERGGSMGDRAALRVRTDAKEFALENLTVQNDWAYKGDGTISNESADVIHSEGEGAMYVNVRFLGYQDTICANKNHQYYYKCYITGNVDFIYGNSGMALFNDCDIVFRYNANKNSGYVTAMKNDASTSYGALFNECRITAENGCSGTSYYLGRPWGEESATTFVDCYMSGIINRSSAWRTWGGKDFSTDEAAFAKVRYYEHGSYGAGYTVNKYRKQLSDNQAASMISAGGLGWDPYSSIITVSDNFYVGNKTTASNDKVVEEVYNSDKYSQYEGNDTGLAKYAAEGYAQSEGTTGGGLLKESNSNYYAVSNAEEFLDALLKIKKNDTASVIEIKADLNLGNLEVKDYNKYSSIAVPHNEPLSHPELLKTGVSRIILKEYNDLTIFSSNGSSINHASFDIQASNNIIIRNIVFDELWEWDEATSGDYDVNDWDFIVVQNGSDRIWIDHCTFYKAYDGIVDVKTNTTANNSNITVSWCEFLPGSENNTFFNVMMDAMSASPDKYPYYKSLLDSGMSKEQIWWYAYGQKKTHLLGQSDSAVENTAIRATFANNYYFDSMDRMPRLRYGNAHVYNCIMDAQELYDARLSIKNEEAAKHIVSNGAASTCGGQLLLENCYISGIMNALNSGNGSSPSGYINAVNSSYYMNGVSTKLEPKCNTTGDTRVLITDEAAFKANLPYSGYTVYPSEQLDKYVKPYVGAGRLNFTVLQWEKTVYNDSVEVFKPGANKVLKVEVAAEDTLPSDALTDEVKKVTGCTTPEELVAYLKTVITDSKGALNILKGVDIKNTKVYDVKVMISFDGGLTWTEATPENFPKSGVDVILPYPTGTNRANFDFVVGHLVTKDCNGIKAGTLEYFNPTLTEDGLKIHIYAASPFVIGYKQVEKPNVEEDDYEEQDNASATTGDIMGGYIPLFIIVMVASMGIMTSTVIDSKKKKVYNKN